MRAGRALTRPAIVWFGDDLRLDDHAAARRRRRRVPPCSSMSMTKAAESSAARRNGGWTGRSRRLEPRARRQRRPPGHPRRTRDDLDSGTSPAPPARPACSGAAATAERSENCGPLKATLAAEGAGAKELQHPAAARALGGRRRKRPALQGVHAVLAPPSRARPPARAPARARAARSPRPGPRRAPPRVELAALGLQPAAPDWSAGLAEAWTPGEAGARAPAELSSTTRCRLTPTNATGRIAVDIAPVARICASARSRRAGSRATLGGAPWRAAQTGGRRRNSCPNSAGANSLIRCSTPPLIWRPEPGSRSSSASLSATMKPAFAPGRGARPAIRSSTPACANSGRPASCTTACA